MVRRAVVRELRIGRLEVGELVVRDRPAAAGQPAAPR
jgi:hypothetical protein